MREPDQFEGVGDLAVAAREYQGNLVAQHQLHAREFEVAQAHRNILRLGRAPEHVDDFEALAQLDQVAKVLERAGAAATRAVHDVRRSGGRRERHAPVG